MEFALATGGTPAAGGPHCGSREISARAWRWSKLVCSVSCRPLCSGPGSALAARRLGVRDPWLPRRWIQPNSWLSARAACGWCCCQLGFALALAAAAQRKGSALSLRAEWSLAAKRVVEACRFWQQERRENQEERRLFQHEQKQQQLFRQKPGTSAEDQHRAPGKPSPFAGHRSGSHKRGADAITSRRWRVNRKTGLGTEPRLRGLEFKDEGG